MPHDQARIRGAALLAELGLPGAGPRHPRDLSVGERERVALAAALAADPLVLLLDEPTRGMDPARRAQLAAIVRARVAGGAAAIVATHDRAFAAAACDRTVALRDGRAHSEPVPGADPGRSRGVSAASTLALSGLALLAAGLFAFERRRFDPRALALAATLAALATAGRVLVPIPSAKPVTAVCLLAGICLGPASGAAVGASTALLSNAFLGQGPWTPWQMLLWGLIGVAGGLLGPVLRNRTALVAAGAIAALAFGACMNVLAARDLRARAEPAGLRRDAVGGPPVRRHPRRGHGPHPGRDRPGLDPAARPLRGALGGALGARPRAGGAGVRGIAVAALAAAALAGPLTVSAAAGPTQAAVDYLAARQAAGGCYAEPGGAPSPELTAWVAMGLRAVRAPVPAGARACLARSARSARVPTDAQRTVLGLVAAGGDPRRDGGVDLVARVRGQIRRDGSTPPTVNATAFGALALRAAGARVPASVRRAILRAQQRGGAWGLGGLPDSNITAAAIEALVATGSAARSRPVDRGVAALARFRQPAATASPWAPARHPVHRLGGPGPGRRRSRPRAGADRPEAPAALRRVVRLPARPGDHPGVGDRTGAARARPAAAARLARPGRGRQLVEADGLQGLPQRLEPVPRRDEVAVAGIPLQQGVDGRADLGDLGPRPGPGGGQEEPLALAHSAGGGQRSSGRASTWPATIIRWRPGSLASYGLTAGRAPHLVARAGGVRIVRVLGDRLGQGVRVAQPDARADAGLGAEEVGRVADDHHARASTTAGRRAAEARSSGSGRSR